MIQKKESCVLIDAASKVFVNPNESKQGTEFRITRRGLLVASMAAALSAGFSANAQQQVSVKDYGAVGDGVANDTDALVRALSEYQGDLLFPKGTYRFTHAVVVAATARKIVFEAGAILRGDNPQEGGLVLRNGSATEIDGITISWATNPTSRVSTGTAIRVQNCTDVILKNATINSASGAGLLFSECTRPIVDGAKVRDTLADGVHFANCNSPVAKHIETTNTGDDGLAFVNYEKLPMASGGYASDVMVTDSKARGIAVVGQSDVVVEKFVVLRTRVSALYVAQEPSYNTRYPQGVTFKDGQVDGAGTLQGPGGNRFGIEVVRGRDVHFERISLSGSSARLVSIWRSYGVVELTDVLLAHNQSGEGVHLDTNESVKLTRVWINDASNTGLYAYKIKSLEWQDLVIEDAASRGVSNSALFIEEVDDVVGDAVGVVRSDSKKYADRFVLRAIAQGKIKSPYLAAAKNKIPTSLPNPPVLFVHGASTNVQFVKPEILGALSPEVIDSPGLVLLP